MYICLYRCIYVYIDAYVYIDVKDTVKNVYEYMYELIPHRQRKESSHGRLSFKDRASIYLFVCL